MYQLKKAYLEISNICNLSCSFCPGTRRPKGAMTPEQFRILAQKLRPHTRYLYLHLMGEPLLHPQLPELLTIADQLDLSVMITTNGTLLERSGPTLCASRAVEKVSISVHSFEGNQGTGDLDDYLGNCIRFAQAAARAGKRCALRLWNLDGPDTKGENLQNAHILSLLERNFPKPWKEGRRGITLSPNIYLEWGERFDWPDLEAPEETGRRFCYALRDQVGVLWDGTVVPCCLDHEGDIPLGDLYQSSLQEILDSPRARAIYDGFSSGRASEALCRRCGFIRRFR